MNMPNEWDWHPPPPEARKILGDILIDLAEQPLPPGLSQLANSRKITINDALLLGWSACLIALKHEYTRLFVTEDKNDKNDPTTH
jgi:hypothetical protein